MKVQLTKTIEPKKPMLKVSFDLESGTNSIHIEYECPNCAGYGCGRHGGPGTPGCSNGTIRVYLEAKDVLQSLGPDFKPILNEFYSDVVGEH